MPLCFEVRINDGPSTIAGEGDISVLSAVISYVASRNELGLQAGGLISRGPHDHEHVDWLQRDLRVGDTVTLRIVESDTPSAPVARRRDDPGASERHEREYFEQLKKKYG